MMRFLATFFIMMLVGVVLLTRPEVKHAFSEPWGNLLAHAAFGLISPVDGSVTQSGNVLSDSETSFAVAIDAECNGIDIVMLFWVAVIAFPAGWKQKAVGLAVGLLGLQALNLVRIISLFYLGQWDKDVFIWSHHNLWQGLMMFGAIMLFYGWLKFAGHQANMESE